MGDHEVEDNEVVGVCAKSSWTTWLKYLVPGPEYLNDAVVWREAFKPILNEQGT